MTRAAVLVSGGGANLQAIIDACHFGEFEDFQLAAVISSVPEAHALERARAARVPAYSVEREIFPNSASFCNALLNKLRDLDIDLVITAGFAERLNYPLLHFYKNRVISAQPALFPMYCTEKGFEPIAALESMIRDGVRVSGATAYFMGEEDNGCGPIILQQTVEVLQNDTPAALQDRIMRLGEWRVLLEAIKLYCAGRLTVDAGRVIISD